MPVLTIDLGVIGLPITDASGWVQAVDSLGNPMPIVASAGTMVFGSRALDFDVDGVATIDLPSTDDLEPVGVRYLVFLTRTDTNTQPVAVGPFLFTATASLDAVAELPPADVAAAITASVAAAQDLLAAMEPLGQLAARLDGYTDHGAVSGVLTVDPTAGTHVLDATGALLVTLNDAPDGYLVTLLVTSGASDVTVDGVDAILTDGAFASFVRIRGVWVLASAGSSAPPGAPTEVTPGAVTFNDTGNVTTVPFTTGVRYKRNGTTVTTTPTAPEPGGLVTYTAEAKTGYVIASGATVSWAHTYPAPPATYGDLVLALNPTYYYPLDDAPGTTAPHNLGSGSGAASVISGVTFGAASLGDGPTSADFTNGRINMPTAANLNGVGSFTIGVITVGDSTESTQTIASGGGDIADGWVIGPIHSGVEAGWINAGGVVIDERQARVITWDGTTFKVYKNASSNSTANAGPLSTSQANPCIGQCADGTWPFDGRVAGFFIAPGVVATAGQVAALVASAGA